MNNKLIFSGHDTFHCRLFWLKKGFDYISEKDSFKDNSGVDLGVGRNMVNAIRFWLRSFGVITGEKKINPLYQLLLSDNGWDPYLEHEATLYLLHYELCAHNHASIYNLIFRELRKIKPEFSRQHFVDYIKGLDTSQNEKILEKDFSVFVRTYASRNEKSKEDSFSGLMTELNLLKEVGTNQKNEKLYRIANDNQTHIPVEILFYGILKNKNYSNSISFKSLYSDEKGIGNIFCFEQDKLEDKLIELSEKFDYVTYNSEAGVKELQLKIKPDPLNILKLYYEK